MFITNILDILVGHCSPWQEQNLIEDVENCNVHVESGMDIAALSPTLPFKSW
jgi:hypothetical protein